MELALAIATLINTVAPGIAQIVMIVRQSNGNVAIVPMLDQAAAGFEADIQSAQAWLKSHPAK